MVRSLEVFLKLWAVCLVFFFLIAVKRELISKSNVAAVASPLYMAGSRRTDSLELYSTESQTQLDDPPGRAANMEYEVGYTNHFCFVFVLYFHTPILFCKPRKLRSNKKLPEVKRSGHGDKVSCTCR